MADLTQPQVIKVDKKNLINSLKLSRSLSERIESARINGQIKAKKAVLYQK